MKTNKNKVRSAILNQKQQQHSKICYFELKTKNTVLSAILNEKQKNTVISAILNEKTTKTQ